MKCIKYRNYNNKVDLYIIVLNVPSSKTSNKPIKLQKQIQSWIVFGILRLCVAKQLEKNITVFCTVVSA